MVKQIVRDQMFLSQKSSPMTTMDAGIIADMQDTLAANQARCVGMAGNMIGYKKRIIIVSMGFANVVMLNPVLLSKAGAYETEEGCLSLDGTRKVTRYRDIEVEFQDASFAKKRMKFNGYIAQILLHEMDHREGRII